MGEYLRRLREPVLAGVLVVTALLQLVALANFALLVFGQRLAYAAAARAAAASAPSMIWIFAAVALALSCLLIAPPSARARQLVTAAATVLGVVAACSVLFWVLGLFGSWTIGSGLAALGWLIETVVRVACAVLLWRLRRVNLDEQAHIANATAPTGGAPGTEPVWRPEQAVGLQWHRAGDAATGAAAPTGSAAPAALEPNAAGLPALPARGEDIEAEQVTPGAVAPEPAVTPPSAVVSLPSPPAPPAPPVRRTAWSRGGIAPDEQASASPTIGVARPVGAASSQPWTTAAQAADGLAAGAPDPASPAAGPRRPAPDWTPAPRPE